MFGRIYKLELSRGNGKLLTIDNSKSGDCYDIKFDVSLSHEAQVREGRVSILGLSRQSMENYLSLSSLNPGQARKKMVRCKLQAGYLDTGMVDIIDGYAYYATISMPPRIWLDINVSEANVICGEKFQTPILKEKKISGIASTVLRKYGDTFSFVGTNKDVLEKKSYFPGRLLDERCAIRTLNTLGDWSLVKEGNVVYGYNASPSGVDCNTSLGNPTINEDAGLLGVSGISNFGCTVTTFLSAKVKGLSRMTLQSSVNKQANGNYLVISKRYRGHYMGNEWHTVLECVGKK